MADTETIRKDESLSRVDRDQAPDRAVTLALDAVDEAYQEHVKRLFEVAACDAGAAMSGLPEAMAHVDTGLWIAKTVRAEMRKRITTGA